MIVSKNREATADSFERLMKATDKLLTEDAAKNPKYYLQENGAKLEGDVLKAMEILANENPFLDFRGTIVHSKGKFSFPDIIAHGFLGVEVKSSVKNTWKTTGSSVQEETRVADIDRIFLLFGKLGGKPIEFRTRPYQDVMSGIAVTHSPRYTIDMNLKQGATIFDRMGMPYETLRKEPSPAQTIADYLRKNLKPGESVWWSGGPGDSTVRPVITLWKKLKPEEKAYYFLRGLCQFPETVGGKYDKYSLWLCSQGIVNPNVRDPFSAGGRKDYRLKDGRIVKIPAVLDRIVGAAEEIRKATNDDGMPCINEKWIDAIVEAIGSRKAFSYLSKEDCREVLKETFPVADS